ncbi:MAG: hypothetical protein IJM31_02670, partial [Campylobacter sp.]|nr:hypothetical protein [Campylobacter sp.]
ANFARILDFYYSKCFYLSLREPTGSKQSPIVKFAICKFTNLEFGYFNTGDCHDFAIAKSRNDNGNKFEK